MNSFSFAKKEVDSDATLSDGSDLNLDSDNEELFLTPRKMEDFSLRRSMVCNNITLLLNNLIFKFFKA